MNDSDEDMDAVRPDAPHDDDEEIGREPILFPDIESKKAFLTKPCPVRYGIVQCYIERTKQGFRNNTSKYDVYLRDGKYFIYI